MFPYAPSSNTLNSRDPDGYIWEVTDTPDLNFDYEWRNIYGTSAMAR